MWLKNILKERGVPELMRLTSGREVKTKEDFAIRREELLRIVQEEIYGYVPKKPDHLEVELIDEMPNYCAGKATKHNLKFTVTVGEAKFSFPVVASVPKGDGPHPAFVLMNFRPDVPDRYLPTEEIIDGGFAVFSFCYTDVTSDDNDFKNGIAPIFRPAKPKDNAPGKIAMWAWAAMRVMDYIQGLDRIDKENVAIIGHSRLGKTALLCGGIDERFKYVISNDSGCSGAAITRGKQGESVAVITNVFPFWFCPRYVRLAENFLDGGYDQHFLMALTAPRHLMVGSAEEDIWADPESEFLGAAAASEAHRLLGRQPLIHKNEIPKAKCVLDEGDVFYHVRRGTHYLSREDWGEYMKYIRGVIEKNK